MKIVMVWRGWFATWTTTALLGGRFSAHVECLFFWEGVCIIHEKERSALKYNRDANRVLEPKTECMEGRRKPRSKGIIVASRPFRKVGGIGMGGRERTERTSRNTAHESTSGSERSDCR